MTRSTPIPTTPMTDFEIVVNGETRGVTSGTTVAGFLDAHGVDPDLVVVEHNRTILPRAAFDAKALEPGDRLEVVHFVGGG